MEKSYFVATGCGNPDCPSRTYLRVINAITYDSARETASHLRQESTPEYCSICGRLLGYYAMIVEENGTKNPPHLM
jgi:hypothetical protein